MRCATSSAREADQSLDTRTRALPTHTHPEQTALPWPPVGILEAAHDALVTSAVAENHHWEFGCLPHQLLTEIVIERLQFRGGVAKRIVPVVPVQPDLAQGGVVNLEDFEPVAAVHTDLADDARSAVRTPRVDEIIEVGGPDPPEVPRLDHQAEKSIAQRRTRLGDQGVEELPSIAGIRVAGLRVEGVLPIVPSRREPTSSIEPGLNSVLDVRQARVAVQQGAHVRIRREKDLPLPVPHAPPPRGNAGSDAATSAQEQHVATGVVHTHRADQTIEREGRHLRKPDEEVTRKDEGAPMVVRDPYPRIPVSRSRTPRSGD